MPLSVGFIADFFACSNETFVAILCSPQNGGISREGRVNGMCQSVQTRDNKVLTREALAKLLFCFDPDPDKAAGIHEEMRRKLWTFFEFRNCTDPTVLADETMSRVAQSLLRDDEIRSANISSYFYGVARNVYYEYHRASQKEAAAVEEVARRIDVANSIDRLQEVEAASESKARRLNCLERCLERLSDEDRMIVTVYHHAETDGKVKQKRAMLARQVGKSPAALKMHASRIRAKLREWILLCVQQAEGVVSKRNCDSGRERISR